MTKEEFIKKTILDLPSCENLKEMNGTEWYGWFEEVYDYALKQGKSEQLKAEQEAYNAGYNEGANEAATEILSK